MVLKKIITFVCFICFLIHSLYSFCSNYLNENNAVNVNPVSLSSIPFSLLLEITLRPGDFATKLCDSRFKLERQMYFQGLMAPF